MLPIQFILKDHKQFIKQAEWSIAIHKGKMGVCVFPNICRGFTQFIAFDDLGYNRTDELFNTREFPDAPNMADPYSSEHDWYIGVAIFEITRRYELTIA